jgi:hypothetical protein
MSYVNYYLIIVLAWIGILGSLVWMWLARSSANRSLPKREQNRCATVQEIVDILGVLPQSASFTVDMPLGERTQPEELWISRLGVWVRCDGSMYSCDGARGFVFPGPINRWRLRRAINRWRAGGGNPFQKDDRNA